MQKATLLSNLYLLFKKQIYNIYKKITCLLRPNNKPY